jgi:sirohydrochlorin cobaltochelatase
MAAELGSASRMRSMNLLLPAVASVPPLRAGVLVVGHGTTDPVGAAETRAVAALVAGAAPAGAVELAFLELLEPSIDTALERLVARGHRDVVAAPLLLFSAGHARSDVPAALAEAAARLGCRVAQAEPLGTHPAIVALADRRRHEALASRVPVPAAETIDVVVGRGASDGGAADRLAEFVTAGEHHRGGNESRRTELGFVAAARPTVAEALHRAAEARPRRVVVRPHLLFSGRVEQDVAAAVAAARHVHPRIEWVLAPRLGADPLVAEALQARITAVGPFPVGDTPAPVP